MIPIKVSVKQGDLLSPILFNMVIDPLMAKAAGNEWGSGDTRLKSCCQGIRWQYYAAVPDQVKGEQVKDSFFNYLHLSTIQI